MKARLQGVHPVLAASDVTVAVQFYRGLGFTLLFQDTPEEPRYACVKRDDVELHIQWAGPEQWAHPVDRPAYRYIVSDVDAIYREFVECGGIAADRGQGSPWAAPADTPWGTREFHIHDPCMNSLQFYRPL
jgi:catechol 2,3-dioxygenase-like lactoylglutathione lyase family enzyme